MLVEEYMTRNPMSVAEDVSIVEAAKRMKESQVRRFPVVRDGKLIGIVTDRDLRSAAPSGVFSFDAYERELMPELHSMLSDVKIKDIMSREVVSVDPRRTIVDAARLMLKHRISGLPVVNPRGELVGIITETDIFKILVDLSGVSLGKTTLALHLEDRPDSLKEVVALIRAHGGRPASILTSHTLADPQFRRVYVRIRALPAEKLRVLEGALRERFELLYVAEDGDDGGGERGRC